MNAVEKQSENRPREYRSVESAVLALLIEWHPAGGTEADILSDRETVTEIVTTPEREGELTVAVEGLLGVGLLIRDPGTLALTPTPAALRSGEFELGFDA